MRQKDCANERKGNARERWWLSQQANEGENGKRLACEAMIGRQGKETHRNVNQLQNAAYLLPVPKGKSGCPVCSAAVMKQHARHSRHGCVANNQKTPLIDNGTLVERNGEKAG